jgi:hypothetical protein
MRDHLLRRQELTHRPGWVRRRSSSKVSVCTLQGPHFSGSREGCHWWRARELGLPPVHLVQPHRLLEPAQHHIATICEQEACDYGCLLHKLLQPYSLSGHQIVADGCRVPARPALLPVSVV